MRKLTLSFGIATLAAIIAIPVIAQESSSTAPLIPGAKDASRVEAGNYSLDSAHSQIIWEANHFGFSDFTGIFGGVTGNLTLDPENPTLASVDIEIPIGKIMTTSEGLTKHMMTAEFFDVATHPTAKFKSTKVEIDGEDAKITGDLTIRGVTKSVVLISEFTGAGINPFGKKLNVGFEAETTIKRSDFGVSYGIPLVSDDVELEIIAAFQKQ